MVKEDEETCEQYMIISFIRMEDVNATPVVEVDMGLLS